MKRASSSLPWFLLASATCLVWPAIVPAQEAAGDLVAEVPTVGIQTVSSIAEETSAPLRRLRLLGRFLITRTGPTNQPLPVFVRYGGTASPTKDCAALPWLVDIPAGSASTEIEVDPLLDGLPEPIEILEASVSECPPETDPPLGMPCALFYVDPAHARARVFLRDDGITTATIEMTAPADGAVFAAGESIPIEATAIDLEGAITHVDFFDGDQPIGESTIFFFVEPPPGTPVQHEFLWSGAAVGKHLLTTRGVAASGRAVASPAVSVAVTGTPELPLVSIRATVPETTEPSPTTRVRPAVFTLERTGAVDLPLRVFVQYTGSAMPGSDYAALPAWVEIPSGTSRVDVLVAPLDDLLIEGDETVIAQLAPSPLASLPAYRIDPDHDRATAIIHDNDLPPIVPIVSITSVVAETGEPLCPPDACLAPEPAPGVMRLTRRGGDLSLELAVLLRHGGTAINGVDDEELPSFVTFAAGKENVDLLVRARFDEAVEGDEVVISELLPDPSLGPVERYRVDPAQALARVVIHDRTPPAAVVTIVATDPFAREGMDAFGRLNPATMVVRRAGPTNASLVIRYLTRGTASNGVDYAPLSGSVEIPAGRHTARLAILPIDDAQPEPPETVVVALLAPDPVDGAVPYSVGVPARAAALIVDNERIRPPCIRFSDGLFNLCLPMESVSCFRVEGTRDLVHWTPLCTIPLNEGAAHYIDPDAGELGQRFYRLIPAACEPED